MCVHFSQNVHGGNLLTGPRRSYDSDDDYEISDAESATSNNDHHHDNADDDDDDDDDPAWKPSRVNITFSMLIVLVIHLH